MPESNAHGVRGAQISRDERASQNVVQRGYRAWAATFAEILLA